MRKEALDEVDVAIKGCSGLIDTSSARMKALVELLRALRDRLSDTQINLKPIAARVIGSLLSLVDQRDQPKLGKLVYAPLINCVMNDIKKPMRDASLEALRQATARSSLDGGGVNTESLEGFITSLVGEVSEKSIRVS
jgi:hypothetical protein